MNIYKFKLDHYKNKIWYLNDNYHRDHDKPAYIWYDGSKAWYQYGKKHRDNNKPAIILSDGRMEYWVNGGNMIDLLG